MDVAELRRHFHELANKLNIISTKAGVAVKVAPNKNYESMTKEALLLELKDILVKLSVMEKAALEAGQLSEDLKKIVYTSLNIDKAQR